MIELIVFLGNPGKKYERNRHNAGRLLSAKINGGLILQNRFKGRFAAVKTAHFKNFSEAAPLQENASRNIYLLEPETFMNLSGESAAAAANFYKIPPENILVAHDDLELSLGEAALKFGGGLSGHKGLRSINEKLPGSDFWRLRIGIGRPAGPKQFQDISAWVLSDFNAEETAILEKTLEACGSALAFAVLSTPGALLPKWKKNKIV